MLRLCAGLCTLTLALGSCWAQDGQIPPELLLKLKAATVFVKAEVGPNLRATGSGFVFSVDGKTALIATNEHVVVPPTKERALVQVVFDSGRKTERTLDAEILATDALRDLAILRVKNVADLPAPIAFNEKLDLVETMPIYSLGFPFGEQLGTGGKNPAITIGKGSISSLREDEKGTLKAVQIDGDLNPGNSGGPVVDTKGRLVGVAVARIRGTRIGLAIPAPELNQLLEGRVSELNLRTVKAADGQAEIEVTLGFIDPLNKIKQASVLVTRSDLVKSPLVAGKDGNYPPLPEARTIELKLTGQVARGTFQVPADGKNTQSITVQPTFTDGATRVARLQPARPHLIDFVRSAVVSAPTGITGAGKVEKVGELQVQSGQIGEGVAKNCLCWAGDGKSFYYLDGQGTAYRVSYPDLKVEATCATGAKVTWLSQSAAGILLTVEKDRRGEVWILDPVTLVKQQSYALGAVTQRVVSSPKSHLAYADEVAIAHALLKVIDLKTGRVVKQYRHDDFDLKAINFTWMVASDDGKHLFTQGGFGMQVFRFRIEGEAVFVEETTPAVIEGRFEGICVSADGRYMAAPCWPGNRAIPAENRKPGNRTHVFSTATFKQPALTVENGGPSMSMAFDLASGLIYATDYQNHLVLFDAEGKKISSHRLGQRPGGASVRQILVHPQGRQLLILSDGGVRPNAPTVFAVTLPAK